jgi:F-type H+-transporting ATPase subunit epsilon
MAMFKLTVASPEQLDYEGMVEILNVYTVNGQIGVLTNHAPFVDVVVPCEITFKDETDKINKMTVSSGWIFVWTKNVTLLVNASEFDYDINIDRAMKEKERVEQLLLQDDKKDIIESMHLKTKLKKEINRIETYNNSAK